MVATVNRVNPRIVQEGALLTKRTVLQQAAIQGIHGLRLRGVGKKGARLSVNYKLTDTQDMATAFIHARGPWQLIENNTSPHEIDPKRKQALTVGTEFYGSVQHPGTQGKHVWRNGVTRAQRGVKKLYTKQVGAAVKVAFKA